MPSTRSTPRSRRLDGVVGQLRKTFEASDDWKQAEAALKDAQTARDAAVAKVTAALQNDATYKSLVDQKAKASSEVQRLRESGNASSQQMTAALNASLDATTAVTQREQSAISYDDAARAAVSKYNEAAAHVAQLRQKFLDSIKTSPELKSARDALTDAKKSRDQAVTDLADAENRVAQIADQTSTDPKQPTTHGSSSHNSGSRRTRIHIQ